MKKEQRFIDEINSAVLVGDGAIGTELLARGAAPNLGIERLNLLAPDMVLNLHRDYVAAGSRVIETNTFGANRPNLARYNADSEFDAIVREGVRLTRQAANGNVYIAGSVGPLPLIEGEPLDRSEKTDVLRELITALLEGGVDLLLFETFTDLEELMIAISAAKQLTDLPVISQMAFELRGKTAGGDTAEAFAQHCIEAGADVLGANCGEGIPAVIDAVTRIAPFEKPISAYLNAGFAEQIEERRMYLATPDYLARRSCELIDLGVHLIGGCCGTGPATISAISQCLSTYHAKQTAVQGVVIEPEAKQVEKPAEITIEVPKVPTGILVELDPPKNLNIEPLIESAHRLREAGVGFITVADNPLASVSADVMTVAGLLKQQTGLSVIPHMTGRDRNRIALQSHILGAHILGIRSMLCVTGDPVRMYNETDTSGVFDLTSIGLVKLITEFNEGRRTGGETGTAFSIGVALNPNVRNIEGQIRKLKRKIDAGAHYALTQPIFEERRFFDLKKMLEDMKIMIPVFIGIMPLRSARNADFLHNEVPGMFIPEELRNRLRNFDKLEDQRRAGEEIAVELIEKFSPHVHSFYMIAPRNRVDMVIPIVEAAQS